MSTVKIAFHPDTKQAERIINEILPGAIELFCAKNKDYAIDGIDIAATLGTRGQWADMYRKIAKLKQQMWDQNGEGLQFEDAETVIRDLIGHCLLSLLFLKDLKPQSIDDEDDEDDVDDEDLPPQPNRRFGGFGGYEVER